MKKSSLRFLSEALVNAEEMGNRAKVNTLRMLLKERLMMANEKLLIRIKSNHIDGRI